MFQQGRREWAKRTAALLLLGVSASFALTQEPPSEVTQPRAPTSAWTLPERSVPGDPSPVPQGTDVPGFATDDASPMWALTKHGLWQLGTTALTSIESTGPRVISSAPRGFGLAGVLILTVEKTIEAGEIAVPLEDQYFTEQLLIVGGDAGRLRGLHARGVDLRTDPEALAIRARALGRARELEARSSSIGLDGVWSAIANHKKAVASEMAVKAATSWALGKTLERAGLGEFAKRLSPEARIRAALGRSGRQNITKYLIRKAGWVNARARARWVAALSDGVTSGEAEEYFDTLLSALMDDYIDRTRQRNIEVIRNPPPRRDFSAMRLSAVAAAAPVPMPLAAAAAPMPLPVAAVIRTADPLVQAVATDNYMIRVSQSPRASTDDPNRGDEERRTAAKRALDEAQQEAKDAAWALFHEALKKVGDGKTFAVCSNSTWDGRERVCPGGHE